MSRILQPNNPIRRKYSKIPRAKSVPEFCQIRLKNAVTMALELKTGESQESLKIKRKRGLSLIYQERR